MSKTGGINQQGKVFRGQEDYTMAELTELIRCLIESTVKEDVSLSFRRVMEDTLIEGHLQSAVRFYEIKQIILISSDVRSRRSYFNKFHG